MAFVCHRCAPEGIHEDPWMTNQGDTELTYADAVTKHREAALQHRKNKIARLGQKLDRAWVLAHASKAPEPPNSEEF
jgi:hypothetical protein